MTSQWAGNVGVWNGYLTEAATRGDAEEVKRRLAEVPESMREQVRDHARTVWRIAHSSSGSGRRDCDPDEGTA